MSDAIFFALFEFVLIDGVVLGLLVWQLWSVRKSIREDAAKAARSSKAT